jgi:integrase
MPYQDIPAFMATLRANSSISARALEFLILTASRTGEVLGMRWEEVDLDGGVWTVPAERMKAHKIHRVPLPDRAIQILREMAELKVGEYVFPGERKDAEGKQRPLSQMALAMALRRLDDGKYTAHGFRSSFRDWCGDATDFPRELAEAALAHKVGNEVELAYRRSDALDKRRGLMRAWDNYCGSNEAGRG